MLLAIDTGNTQTIIGTFDARPDGGYRAEVVHHWRVATSAERTSDELALLVSELLGLRGLDLTKSVTGVAISSVVPTLTAAMREMCDTYFSVPTLVLEPGVRTGVPILYNDPKEVGADRIANAVAAYDLYGGPTIIVDFGTATIVDAVSSKGEYLGGAIVPGIEVSLDALFGRAAGLRRVELIEPKHVIGKSTMESVQSGAVYGFAGQVDALVRRFRTELGDSACVATGHLAEFLGPLSDSIEHVEPWLTLHGLRLLFERVHGGGRE